jgi:transcriptional antiterminator RfaH
MPSPAAHDARFMKSFKSSTDGAVSILKSGGRPVGSSYFDQLMTTQSRAQLVSSDMPLWFCLRAQPKHEHLAAITLRRQLKLSCFSPRVRFRKATRRGPVWFVEAMFPGYLFAEFVYSREHRRVEHSPGIHGILHFGDAVATLGSDIIANLRQKTGEQEIVTFNPEIQVGQPVRIAEGPFQGLEALVTRLIPAKERVRVLLEFLGRSLETELSTPKVLPVASPTFR